MKSLGYAYAEFLDSERYADAGMDVDSYFEDIIHGEIEIPKWFVEQWIAANPIFASEEYPQDFLDEFYDFDSNPTADTQDDETLAIAYAAWKYSRDERDYEVIMTDIAHTMERDGELIVFGDVMFGLPNNGRSRISSFGQGADKASARQALIDRAIEHLHRDERMSAENEYQIRDMDNFKNCRDTGWHIYGRKLYYNCNQIGTLVKNSGRYADKHDPINNMYVGNLKLRGTDISWFEPAQELSRISHQLKPESYSDWAEVAKLTNDTAGIWSAEEVENFNAETNSWRIQNRDSSGKFSKGFVKEIDISEFMELDPENIPEISDETKYTSEQTLDFINDMINDSELPTRLIDASFVNTLQNHVSSTDMEMLQGLNDAANMAAFEALMGGSADDQQAAARAVFVTDMLMNYKWGQDYWAAEEI